MCYARYCLLSKNKIYNQIQDHSQSFSIQKALRIWMYLIKHPIKQYPRWTLLEKVPQARAYLGCPSVLSDVLCKVLSPPQASRFRESYNRKTFKQSRSFTTRTVFSIWMYLVKHRMKQYPSWTFAGKGSAS